MLASRITNRQRSFDREEETETSYRLAEKDVVANSLRDSSRAGVERLEGQLCRCSTVLAPGLGHRLTHTFSGVRKSRIA